MSEKAQTLRLINRLFSMIIIGLVVMTGFYLFLTYAPASRLPGTGEVVSADITREEFTEQVRSAEIESFQEEPEGGIRPQQISEEKIHLVGKKLPAFQVDGLSSFDLQDKYSVINLFSTWCEDSTAEMYMWEEAVAQYDLPLYGVHSNLKPDAPKPDEYFQIYQDPYLHRGEDAFGLISDALELHASPSTIVVDRNGYIQYAHSGTMSLKDVEEKILPLISESIAE